MPRCERMPRLLSARPVVVALMVLAMSACAAPERPRETERSPSPDEAAERSERAGREAASEPTGDPARTDAGADGRVAVVASSELEEGREKRRQAFLEDVGEALAPADAGYYMDVLDARLRQDLADRQLAVTRDDQGIVMVLSGLNAFRTGGTTPSDTARRTVTALAEILTEFELALVTIHGHTDRIGDPDFNQWLSEQRAAALAQVLIDEGVAVSRLIAVGHGETMAMVKEGHPGGRYLDRRMEIHLEPLVRRTQ